LLTANEFWRLSQSLYAAPEVQASCLSAQQQQGADVNLLLLLALLQTRGWQGDYRPLLAATTALSPVLQDWRRLRRTLKPKLAPSDYAHLLTHELSLERLMQQTLLAALATESPTSSPADNSALGDYLESIGVASLQRQALIQLLLTQAAAVDAACATTQSPLTEESSC
jgi:uncharacterized protein (TIGR02444 family)